ISGLANLALTLSAPHAEIANLLRYSHVWSARSRSRSASASAALHRLIPVRRALISMSNASKRLGTIASNEGVRGRRLGSTGLIANLPEIPGGRGCAIDDFPRN